MALQQSGNVKLTPAGWEKIHARIEEWKPNQTHKQIAERMGMSSSRLVTLKREKSEAHINLELLKDIFKAAGLGAAKVGVDFTSLFRERTPRSEVEKAKPFQERTSSLENSADMPQPDAQDERHSTQTASRRKIFAVPHEPDCFKGRSQELEKLREKLMEGSPDAIGKKQAITGLGGIGKTQLAIAYALRFREEYEAVFWVNADTEAGIRLGYVEIARLLGLNSDAAQGMGNANLPAPGEEEAKAQKQREQEQAVGAVLHWLDAHTGWLLIMDNADTPEILKPYVPLNPKSHVLLTSRARRLDGLNIHAPLRLGALSAQASLDFFLAKCDRPDASAAERAAVTKLAEDLGHLPLAMAQAAAYVLENDISFAEYLNLYNEQELPLLESNAPPGRDYANTVGKTWNINFQAIVRESQHADDAGRYAPELLKLCAFLAPDDIPAEFILDGAGAYCPELAALVSRTRAGNRRKISGDILKPLWRYSLITTDPEARTFSLHRMIQTVMRWSLGAERREWQERAVRAVDGAYPVPEYENWALCERLQPHAIAVGERIIREGMATAAAGRLLHNVGCFLYIYGRYALAELYARTARDIRRQLPADTQENSVADTDAELDLAASHYSLGLACHLQGKFQEAEDSYRQALTIRQLRLDCHHPDALEVLNALAGLYNSQRRYAEAEPRYRELLERARETLPANDPRIAHIEHNLGVSYYGLRRDQEAEIHFLRALQIREQSPRSNQPYIATDYHDLAQLYQRQERFVESEEFYKKALAIQRQIFRDGHSDTALTCYNLALFYTRRQRYGEAAPLAEECLAIDEELLGKDHPDIGLDLKLLAEAYQHLGRDEDAAQLLRRAETIQSATEPASSNDTLHASEAGREASDAE